jgi:hypothetical protein
MSAPTFSKLILNKVGDGIDVFAKNTLTKTDHSWRVAIANEPIDAKVDGKKFFCVRVDDSGVYSSMMIGFTPMETFDSTKEAWFGSNDFTGCGMNLNGGSLRSSTLLDAIQELRDSGAIAIQISNRDKAVRVVAKSWFGDTTNGVTVSGEALQVPILISVIGDPAVLIPAIKIPGGLVDTVGAGGGKVTFKESENVEISATVPLSNL